VAVRRTVYRSADHRNVVLASCCLRYIIQIDGVKRSVSLKASCGILDSSFHVSNHARQIFSLGGIGAGIPRIHIDVLPGGLERVSLRTGVDRLFSCCLCKVTTRESAWHITNIPSKKPTKRRWSFSASFGSMVGDRMISFQFEERPWDVFRK
jgi:hypothetical protein